MEKSDLLIAEQGKQTFMVVVSAVTKGTIHGFLAKDFHIPTRRTPIELVPQDVVLNLGQNPRPGSIYGVDVTHHVVTKHHDDFQQISFLYRINKDAGKALMAAFDKASAILKKNRLDFLMGYGVWEVRSSKGGGKYAGMYKHSKVPDKNPHRFLIRPEKLPESEFVYCILHEMAHHLHLEYMTNSKLMSRWIIEFNTSIKLATVPKQLSAKLLENLVTGRARPSDFTSDLDEGESNAYRQIIRVIKADHAVGIQELNTLFENDDMEEIRALWPLRTLHKKELAPIVSEYAATSVCELIAEAVSFFLMGKKLPKRIQELVDKTISFARMQHGKGSVQ